jgi:predicted membrane chloride channel (bestrophin family)
MPRGESATSPRRLRAFERQLDALALRSRGLTYQQIGEALGYRDRSGAFLAVQGALKRVARTPAKDAFTLDIERLNELTRAMLPLALGGDLRAISAVLAVMEQRAALLGLDHPAKKPHQF